MNRRTFLALLPATAAAGCLDGSTSRASDPGGKNYTAPPDVEVYDELKVLPDPPDPATEDASRAFVKRYEEHRIHNELLGENVSEDHEGHVGIAEDRDVVELEIEPATVELVRATEHGFYFLSAISGRAEHWCSYDPPADESRSCGSGAGRNATAVMHYVTDGSHFRIPYDWYTCTGPDEPRDGPDSEAVSVSEHDSAAQIQVYNVSERERDIEIAVHYVEGGREEVYAETVGTPPYLAVVADVTARRGTYEIEATLNSGATERFEWVITDDDAPSWTGTSVFVTPTDGLWIETLDSSSGIEIPSVSCPDPPR